ncbi:LLM class flavin-dependent oxidoreductase [Xenorhabdus anantnagensis]|uniref:LLM class flavin-dependent oxidoreductase n=1 Tax=Xenorhabdus anantnagensis TaxID=3025875 RepID=UPI00351E18E5
MRNSSSHFQHSPESPIILSVTKHLGFICTASTTFSDPFILARQFLTLDHLSHGRIGWNAVTTYNPATAKNFGQMPLSSSKQKLLQKIAVKIH